jgi:hypothetical protein
MSAEQLRLEEDNRREKYWKRWGPYLSERQWGTVREDYSANGNSWTDLPHDHARSRAYRWGEDGLLGICDSHCHLAFALALWNGRDPILKERLFGLTGPEGNHGEDVKELYYYLDATPTHSFLKALYKYPQAEYPYGELVEKNGQRGPLDPEYEIIDTGIFDEARYFDVTATYAKSSPDDILIEIEIHNAGPDAATLQLLPTLWGRNTWSWGREGEDYPPRPQLKRGDAPHLIDVSQKRLGDWIWALDPACDSSFETLFTENESNLARLFGEDNSSPYVKDAFHQYIIHGNQSAVNPDGNGSKAAFVIKLDLPAGGSKTIRLRFARKEEWPVDPFGAAFVSVMDARASEADAFYDSRLPEHASLEEKQIMRQAYAGLIWTKQFYYYDLRSWWEGDPAHPAPPDSRRGGRNAGWDHLFNRDILSMPDKWEFPWYAAWDTAFHMVPMAEIDSKFASSQLTLFLREWYLHPNGQMPAYEFAFDDVNPPVHAWGVWSVYQTTIEAGNPDTQFLESAFHKLLMNFTWWINRKDEHGKNIFSGGFLGLDNIGVFDRSSVPIPESKIEQADATAWMAFYCLRMLEMAMELSKNNPAYEDIASKFFEYFVSISHAINHIGGCGLWDEVDGIYHDHLHFRDQVIPVKACSLVGLLPLIAVELLDEETLERLPNFTRRMNWLIENRPTLGRQVSMGGSCPQGAAHHLRLLAIPAKERLLRLLALMLDEEEFLSPFGIRSLSKRHAENPCVVHVNGSEFLVAYEAGESECNLFGGNSNWRGPIWFPLNFLLIESLLTYDRFYGPSLTVEFPSRSGNHLRLRDVARELAKRLLRIFTANESGHRAWHGPYTIYSKDERWKDLQLFHEYFHAETGKGLGASHQTGWTSLITRCIEITHQVG